MLWALQGCRCLGDHFCAHFPRWSTATKPGNFNAPTLTGAVGCVGLFFFGGQFGLPLCLALRGLCLGPLIALKCIVGLACHHSPILVPVEGCVGPDLLIVAVGVPTLTSQTLVNIGVTSSAQIIAERVLTFGHGHRRPTSAISKPTSPHPTARCDHYIYRSIVGCC